MSITVPIPLELLEKTEDHADLKINDSLERERVQCKFTEVVSQLALLNEESEEHYPLAALADILKKLPATLFSVFDNLPENFSTLSPRQANIVTALIEERASCFGLPSPGWVDQIKPLENPVFAAVEHPSLKMHLLTASPVSYRKRNIFMESLMARA